MQSFDRLQVEFCKVIRHPRHRRQRADRSLRWSAARLHRSNAVDKTRGIISETVIRRDAALRLLDLQKRRYKAGVVSYLEVLDAERQLFAAEIELAQSQVARVVGYVDLYRALGGGWTP